MTCFINVAMVEKRMLRIKQKRCMQRVRQRPNGTHTQCENDNNKKRGHRKIEIVFKMRERETEWIKRGGLPFNDRCTGSLTFRSLLILFVVWHANFFKLSSAFTERMYRSPIPDVTKYLPAKSYIQEWYALMQVEHAVPL